MSAAAAAAALEAWLVDHSKGRILCPRQIRHWFKCKNGGDIPLAEMEATLAERYESRYCWSNGVLLYNEIEELSTDPAPPDVEWIRGRWDEKVHTDDCEWVRIFLKM